MYTGSPKGICERQLRNPGAIPRGEHCWQERALEA